MRLGGAVRARDGLVARIDEVGGGRGRRGLSGARRRLIRRAAEGRRGAGRRVLLLGEFVALSVLVARELLVLSDNDQYSGAHVLNSMKEGVLTTRCRKPFIVSREALVANAWSGEPTALQGLRYS